MTAEPGILRSEGRRPWLLPLLAVILCLIYLFSALRPPPRDGDWDLAAFGRLPVVDRGRVKPIDAMARTSLMIISNKQSVRVDGRKTSATRWILDVMTKAEAAAQQTVFRIDHPGVLSLIGHEQTRKCFSFAELDRHGEVLNDQITRARMVPAAQRTPFQRQVLELSYGLSLYLAAGDIDSLYLLPPASSGGEWEPFVHGRRKSASQDAQSKAFGLLTTIIEAWGDDRPAEFNAAVAQYQTLLDEQLPGLGSKLRLEAAFNHAAPFVKTMALYVLAFMLAAGSWLGLARFSSSLARSGGWVLLLALLVHTLGLAARMYIQGRPPVTNLYSSAVGVGWGCVLLGVILERIMRDGIGTVTAAIAGFTTLLIAHHLAGEGDTMAMMQAVLDSNFWLTTHVVAITLGYSAMFLGGLLGIVYIVRGLATPTLSADAAATLGRMIYGIVCFAALFSFAGTVLGGIWADQSWGRFWGWDPKENGALLVVVWCAVILHARIGHMVGLRGLAVLAVFGNVVTAWAWFGTNNLGVGLHSYGFTDSAVFWLLLFVASQLVLVGLGTLPRTWWWSGRPALYTQAGA